MKKSLFIIVLLLIEFVGLARPVSLHKAERVALEFLGIKQETKSASPLHLLWTGEPMTKVGDGIPAFYVFERDGRGFVIVAGDDCIRPILGYSFDSNFNVDGMPENVAFWFNSISELVKGIRRDGTIQSSEMLVEWGSVSTKSSDGVKLITALWNQVSPYNIFTPMLRNGGIDHCYVGCTNTATAIVMRYHEHPEKGVGVLPDYTYSKGGITRTQPGHALGHKYDWNNMPTNNLDESTPLYQSEQVAQLMYDCAVMNKCKWNPYNAETDPRNIPYALATFMDYDRSIRYLERSGYSATEWEKMICEEIDCRRPVIYAGQHEEGNGHAWVIDGYASNGYFYMNWGWGGRSNGYFVISPLSEAAMNFTINHRMVIGIKPDEGGGPSNSAPYLVGSSTSNWRFNLNSSFTTVFNIKNDGFLDHIINCRVALTDKSGKLKGYISDPLSVEIPGFQTINAQFNCLMKSMPEVDDLIILYNEDNGEWKAMEYSDESVIKMKGPSAIEDCTTVTYSKETHILTIATEKDNAIQIYYTDSGGRSFIRMSQQNSGTNSINTASLPTNVGGDYSPYDFTVHVFNIAESKEFRLIIKN